MACKMCQKRLDLVHSLMVGITELHQKKIVLDDKLKDQESLIRNLEAKVKHLEDKIAELQSNEADLLATCDAAQFQLNVLEREKAELCEALNTIVRAWEYGPIYKLRRALEAGIKVMAKYRAKGADKEVGG